ncbi:MAG: amidohydrolase family protein [Candidatus Thorarchaeota archaeon]
MMTFTHYDFEYFDVHTHFFPPQIFEAIWAFFEQRDENNHVTGWPVNYKLTTNDLVKVLKRNNVKYFATHNYAHKAGVAEYINNWTKKFALSNKNIIPFGCVWPEDNNRSEYTKKIFDEFNFYGIKIQPLVQKFFLDDARMYEIYDLIFDKGKWLMVHIGTAPYRNQYVGYKNFINFLEKYPDMNIIVAHMGAFEYTRFLKLLDKHPNLYLDTAMIYIPNNIFPERGPKRPKPKELISYQDRILFGSDFPNIPYDYENSTRGLLEFDLPRSFYENIFLNNAKRIFKVN